ncbi:tail fiber domain-containing protein, partial [bacterium]|nr:tail fiber domain-containing protein [bacterium]
LPAGAIVATRVGTGLQTHVEFCNNGGTSVGKITTNGSATAYVTSSDVRLKENITNADDPFAKINAIQVRQFDWKADGSHQDYGFIAQELVEVAPEAVSQGETEEDIWGVDPSKLVPVLVKAIQELTARLEALEA